MTAPSREIRGYEAVRAAARDYATYSSDLLGDRDVRTYRQLPLEADPPRHTLYREALQQYFLGAAIEPYTPRFKEHARTLIQAITNRGGGEIGTDLALPYVMGCLATIYNRPQDYDEWVSWGTDVWTAEAYSNGGEVTPESFRAIRERDFTTPSQRSGRLLEDYLHRVFDLAERRHTDQAPATDIWDHITRLRIADQALTRDEKYGIANVLLAGGRGTVIQLITGLTWHLIATPHDREYLTTHPEAHNNAITELVRFLSPLPKMERVLPEDRTPDDADRDPSKYVLLSFVSANHDRSVWNDPHTINIHRERRPHLAFGFGRHSCMGMNITEHETHAFLNALLADWPGWQFDGQPDIEWTTEGDRTDTITIIDRFVNIPVTSQPPTPSRRAST